MLTTGRADLLSSPRVTLRNECHMAAPAFSKSFSTLRFPALVWILSYLQVSNKHLKRWGWSTSSPAHTNLGEGVTDNQRESLKILPKPRCFDAMTENLSDVYVYSCVGLKSPTSQACLC